MWSALLSIPPSRRSLCLTSIPARAFHQRNKLDKDKVEFCEGLMKIGKESFGVGAIIPCF